MSTITQGEITDCVHSAGARAVWRQWARLGANVLGDTDAAQSVIDPEALLLFTLYVEPAERRLRDIVYWWANVGSDLLSVQRTKTLLDRYPPATEERLGHFAQWAVEAGDNRWRRYAANDPASGGEAPRSGKGIDHPRLGVRPALVLRLRAGFGVNAKAEVLAYLLGIHEREASTQEIADATAYSRPTVGGALQDMARAGFIQETGRRSARYVAPVKPWAELLQFGGERRPVRSADSSDAGSPNPTQVVATWQPWADVFAFLAETSEWADASKDASDYLRSSQARDLYERYQHVFASVRLDVPHPEAYRGAAYLDAFAETVQTVTGWMDAHL